MTAPTSGIEEHPDLVTLRARYARAAATPTAQGLEVLTLLTGVYLAASPWIVGFNAFPTLAVNNLITGITLAVLGFGFGAAYERTYGMSGAAGLIGVWTIIAPWVVAGNVATTATIINNVILGGLVVILATATGALGKASSSRRRQG
ncbi:SPW repeat protein [Streptomyces gobiensis]|uniref:SPW repeat protein n=1 Tax=Streptomyces gobiensis TaxID=2875706 RepID=UPI001E3AB3DC|nr:SPW repeat protein [Streptomyces gobiensis]UGY93643.1 SPW repeat protein [Streptomyces gobiensis]